MQRALSYLLILIAVIGVCAYGQTFRGAINGTVTDPTGAVVAGAMVTATDTATNIAHSMAATGDGQFSFQDLPPGTYSVKVAASGFQTTTISNVTVTAGNVYTVPAQLIVGQQATAVEQVNIAISNLARAAKETEVSSNQTLQTAGRLAGLSRDLTQLIQSGANA